MFIKQISAFVENRPGRIAEITEILAENDIDLRALSIADTADFGILRIIVDNPDKVAVILKENKVTVSLTDVIAIKLPDKPGALNYLLKLLSDNRISVEYLYAFVAPSENGSACVVIRADNPQAAAEILRINSYRGISNL